VARHELPEGAFQALLVDLVRALGELEQRVAQSGGVAAVDGEQQVREGCAQQRVESPDRSEVDQSKPAVVKEQDVPGVRVGVKDPVERDLSQQSLQQRPRERGPVGSALIDRR